MRSLLKVAINPNRIYGLDILRAVAILFVVLEHGRDLYPEFISTFSRYIGFDGVSIFFVLSGFLIGSILIRTLEDSSSNKRQLLNFWIRRWVRTLPNYFLILTVLIVLSATIEGNFDFGYVKSLFYFSQNLYSHDVFFFPEAWSISIEEWFYLLVPIVLFTAVRVFKLRTKHVVLATSILIIVIITYLRLERFNTTPLVNGLNYWDLAFRKQVFMRLDSIIYGVLGAYFMYYWFALWSKRKGLVFLLGILILVAQRYFEHHHFDNFGLYTCVFSFSVNAFGTLCLLPFLNNLKSGSGFVFRSLTYISLISYSMYLINLMLVKSWIVQRGIPWKSIGLNADMQVIFQSTAYWSITIVLSILLYKYFELPVMKLRDSKLVARLTGSRD